MPRHVMLGYDSLYPPDAAEAALPDVASARALIAANDSTLAQRLQAVAQRIGASDRVLDAAVLAATRLGLRHGSFGSDFHAYHNEAHVLELAERRLGRVLDALGEQAPTGLDAALLLLFAACHDLRQRETRDVPGPVGGNEAASIAEALRVLDACGFDRRRDRDHYVALELMIAGSTFDARPRRSTDPATRDLPTIAGGALARGLALWLDSEHPSWRGDADARRGERLGRLAADLDTANVGEAFGLLCETALRLCREREMRAGRSLDAAASGGPSLGFLGPGQTHYFFELHHFSSREGERVFGDGKLANADRVRDTSQAMLDRFAGAPPADGRAVLAAFSTLTGAG
jgi:hypothetical protein